MIDELIKKAQSQLGYKEGDNNNTPYGKAYGLNYNPWCMMFVWWCANQVGIDSSIIPKTASCPIAYNWFRNKGQIIKNSNVKKGDIVFFTWDNSINADHVGIVEKVEGNIFTTIEGNKNDAVERRRVSTSNLCIYAIARPAYKENSSKKTSNNTNIEIQKETEADRIKSLQKALNKDFNYDLAVDGIIGQATSSVIMKYYLKYFTKGTFVKWTQTQLKRKGYDIGSYGIDSCYGRDTESAVKKFQKDNGLIVDGYVGIETVKMLVK